MTQSEQEKIIDKIKKLLALAEDGAGATPDEAANAAAKVQELLQKYNLDQSMIKNGPKSSMVLHSFQLPSSRLWTKNLLHVLAVFNFCGAAWNRGGNKAYIMGKQANIDVVLALFDHLAGALTSMAATHYADYCRNQAMHRLRPVPPQTYKTNFYRGAINSILCRLVEQQEKFEKEYQGGKALVISNKDELNTFSEEKFPTAKTVKKFNKRTTQREDGYQTGVKAGLAVELNKLVAEGK